MTRPEPRRDGYGRYLLPDPATGRERGFTRVTTLAKGISDTEPLSRWKVRTALQGTAKRPDLLDLVATTDDRRELDNIADAAMNAAGAYDGAALGTLLHSITEQVDAGELTLDQVPDEHRDDVQAYVTTIAASGIRMIPEWIECLVVNPAVDVAGTFDRVVRLPDGRLAIADLKTGKNLDYGWLEICAQLSIYANAPLMYVDGGYVPLPDVDLDTAIVFHLPVGKGTCTIYEVDISSGWAFAELAAQVRRARGQRNLAHPIDPAEYRSAGIYAGIRAATNREQLAALWHLHSPSGAWTNGHTAAATDRKQELAA